MHHFFRISDNKLVDKFDGAALAFGEQAFKFVLTGIDIPGGSADDMSLKAILDVQSQNLGQWLGLENT